MDSSKTISSPARSRSGLATTPNMAGKTILTSASRAVSRTRPCASGRKSSWTRDVSRPAGHHATIPQRDSFRGNAAILQPSLPAHVARRGLVGALRGTWIGPLGWYGCSESDGGLRLGWALEDDTIGSEILVRPGQLTMTAKVDSPGRFDEATRLGYELFHHVSREISSKADRGISA